MKKFLVSVMLIFVAMLTFACGEPTIKITFDVNGGVGENQVVNVVEGEQINNIKEPTRTDYEFGGWYYDKDIWQDAFDGMGFKMADMGENNNGIPTWQGYVPNDHIFVHGFEVMECKCVPASDLSDHDIVWAKLKY